MTMRVRALRRTLSAAVLGASAALLVASCGSSGRGLIPSAYAGPLQGDFERVVQEAESGGGSCSGTEAALLKTEQDYAALPSTVDGALRGRLREGISKLRADALGLCSQPHPQATVTSTTQRAITPPRTTTTPTVTQTTPTQTTPTTTTPTTAPEGGGTPAPGSGAGESPPGAGQGAGGSPSSGGGPAGGEAGGSGSGNGAGLDGGGK
jgi:hypothetical protein